MLVPNSPLFPESLLTLSPAVTANNGTIDPTLIPNLPSKPLAQSGSIQVYIIPAEKNLFVQGFEPHEYESQPPTLLRGVLVVRILKPCKVKSIRLSFKGIQKTDWPEGIPPKKTVFFESNDTVSHTWPFYQCGQSATNNGADFYRDLDNKHGTTNPDLELHPTNSLSPTSSLSENTTTPNSSKFFTRSLSPAFLRRAVSPSITDNHLSPESDQGLFTVGDYIYNFEHPLRPSIPETCSVTFGTVYYYLEVNIVRIGTFKSNISARLPVEIIRTPSIFSMEENEPIVITRDWEDQLRYDIVVGGKSVVLDSYLPLAFRFVPLWGKVQLHRIRVYLTENIEYYCQNKKVHRLEPPRKYLLLEHKANKGNSLLSKNPHTPEVDPNDDVLNKELEFQLYVPSKLQHRPDAVIHPDTSFENIQVHHWIKICLRLSKTDPENAGKRKHYEISIDSPIHVLSHLAAHSNTLLPVYEDEASPLPQYSTSSPPPLSPNVVAINYSTTANGNSSNSNSNNTFAESSIGAFRNIFHHSNTDNSIDKIVSSSPVTFQHINNSNDEPFERDGDMHLEANLYKPDPETHDPTINGNQAVPYSPNSTPLHRPIHLLRKPSVNPPPFDADVPPPPLEPLPPAYEDQDYSDPASRAQDSSLSPLRIDETDESSDNVVGFVPLAGISTSPIIHAPTPLRPRTTTPSPLGDSNEGTKREQLPLSNMVSSNNPLPSFEISLDQSSQNEEDRKESTEESTKKSMTLGEQLGSEGQSHDDEEHEDTSLHHDETIRGESDITDFPSPIHIPHSPVTSATRLGLSRRSSISSISSEIDNPVDQTMPLLSLSATSVAGSEGASHYGSHLNSSVNSLLFDTGRRLTSTKIMDLGDSNDYHLSNHLGHMRNPRINKDHDENENIEEEANTDSNQCSESTSLDSSGEINDSQTSRNKSFGVIQRFENGAFNSFQQPTEVSQKSTPDLSPKNLPEFNSNYIM